jgi:hypothetical protein
MYVPIPFHSIHPFPCSTSNRTSNNPSFPSFICVCCSLYLLTVQAVLRKKSMLDELTAASEPRSIKAMKKQRPPGAGPAGAGAGAGAASASGVGAVVPVAAPALPLARGDKAHMANPSGG